MNYHKYIILGAGPAGLQMGYFMEQSGHDYLIIEANGFAGSFFSHFPRHDTLISFNKRFNWYSEPDFNLRYDANSLLTHDDSHLFTKYATELYAHKDHMVRYLQDFAKKFMLKIQYNTPVKSISRETDGERNFVLTDSKGNEYRCAQLLLATGAVKPHIPDVEGIELAEGYEDYDTCPDRYNNKRIVIMGRGNSAFEIANSLAGHAAIIFILIGSRVIQHAWSTHFAGHLRAINNTILDMFQLKALHAVSSTIVTKLSRLPDGTIRVDYKDELPHWRVPGTATGWFVVDHVIRSTGFMYVNPELFAPDARPDVDAAQKYPVLNPMWESSVPDMYFIGTTMAARDRKAGSPFIAGYRYNVRTLFHMLEERYHDVPMPSDKFELKTKADLERFGEHLINRMSTTSALYHMFGVLCDVLVLEDGRIEMFYELPADYVLTQPKFAGKRMMISTMEFGYHNYQQPVDTITISRRSDQELPGCVPFLHPVLRYYNECGEFVKGRNTRSSSVLRWDPPASIFEGDVTNMKPRNMLLNFINEVVQVTTDVFSEEHFYDDVELGGSFTPWTADDPRIQNHGQQKCLLGVDDPQVSAIQLSCTPTHSEVAAKRPSLVDWWKKSQKGVC